MNPLAECCRDGDLELLKNLLRTEQIRPEHWTIAASWGRLNIIEYLHSIDAPGCTVWTIDWAAENGHLLVVKFLFLNRGQKCTTNGFNGALNNNHMETVEFIFDNRMLESKTMFLILAKYAHYSEVQGLLEHLYHLICMTNEGFHSIDALIDKAISSLSTSNKEGIEFLEELALTQPLDLDNLDCY